MRQVSAHLERERLTVEALLLTHGHVDHIAGVPALRQRTGAPVSMHPQDLTIRSDVARVLDRTELEASPGGPVIEAT